HVKFIDDSKEQKGNDENMLNSLTKLNRMLDSLLSEQAKVEEQSNEQEGNVGQNTNTIQKLSESDTGNGERQSTFQERIKKQIDQKKEDFQTHLKPVSYAEMAASGREYALSVGEIKTPRNYREAITSVEKENGKRQ
ncbi:hypothetical protein ROZALSC1DRAFT_26259, partial [Rozella allomycis CSF55]